MHLRFIAALLVASLLAASGCSPSATVLEGSVTLNNNSLPSGVISFEPIEADGDAFDGVIENGRYRIEMPAAQANKKYIVRITSLQPTGRKVSPGPPAPAGTLVDEIADVVPSRYNTSSVLNVDLASGEKTDFALKTSSP